MPSPPAHDHRLPQTGPVQGAERGPLRILQVIGNSAVGGAERHFYDLVTELDARGDRVTAVCPRPGPLTAMLATAGIHVEIIDFVRPLTNDEYGFDKHAAAQLQTLIQLTCPHVVHSHLFPAHLHATIAAERCAVPAILTTAHTLIARPADAALAADTRVRTIACAHAAKTALCAAKLAGDRITVVPNGVNVEHLAPVSSTPRFGVLAVSRLAHEKGLDVLLHAAHRLQQRHLRPRIDIAGTGPEEQALHNLAEDFHLTDTVGFLGVRHDVPRLMRNAAIVVCSSRQDAGSLSLLEAMAAGAAVIATSVGGTPEIIEHGVNGLLTPSDHPRSLANALATLLADQQMRAALGANARLTVQRRYTLARQVAETRSLYCELLT